MWPFSIVYLLELEDLSYKILLFLISWRISAATTVIVLCLPQACVKFRLHHGGGEMWLDG